MKKALLIIDIQNEYFKGGNIELYQPEEALRNTKLVLQNFRENGNPVFYIRHININDNAHSFNLNAFGSKIHEEIVPIPGERVLIKHRPNSFYQTGLDEVLKEEKITNLIVCGMMSHMCVDTTVRAAKDLGYEITVVEDACTTKDLIYHDQKIEAKTVHNAFMAALSGAFAEMVTTDKMINE